MNNMITLIDEQRAAPSRDSVAPQGKIGRTRALVTIAMMVFAVAGIGAAVKRDLSVVAVAVMELPNEPQNLPVDTIRIETVTSYEIAREYTGTIVARRVSDLNFERPGLLSSVNVNEESNVAKGTPLATLGNEHLQTKRRETRASRAQAAMLSVLNRLSPRKSKTSCSTSRRSRPQDH